MLEGRLRRATALLSTVQLRMPSLLLHAEINSVFNSPLGSPPLTSDRSGMSTSSRSHLQSMMDGRGIMRSTKKYSTEYYGGPSDYTFLQRTQQLLSQDASGTDKTTLSHDRTASLFDSPIQDSQPTIANVPFSELLPSRHITGELIGAVFRTVYQQFQFLHEPSFQRDTRRIYALGPTGAEDLDHGFLALLNSVLALGYIFQQDMHQQYGCKGAADQAYVFLLMALLE
jgi:hypothetical protein